MTHTPHMYRQRRRRGARPCRNGRRNGLFLFSVWGGAGPQTLREGTHLTRDQKRSALAPCLLTMSTLSCTLSLVAALCRRVQLEPGRRAISGTRSRRCHQVLGLCPTDTLKLHRSPRDQQHAQQQARTCRWARRFSAGPLRACDARRPQRQRDMLRWPAWALEVAVACVAFVRREAPSPACR